MSGEQFFLQQEGDADKILIFATNKNLHLLAEAKSIYVDGTFEVCPRLFFQVFTINAFIQGQQFPLVYGLLPRKSRDVYNRFFMCIKEEALKCDLRISPAEIMTDFELPLVQSLELQFPSACIHGCYFHFTQCLWRKVQSLGLVEEYKEDGSIRQFIQKSATIAFVPSNFVRVAWDGLKTEIPDDDKMKNYSDYFDQNWMNGQFKPCMWNYFAHSGPRTNNHLEGWHNRLKRIARKAHPNFYEVLELFQKEQAATEVTILQLQAGGLHKAKRRKVIQREERIKLLKDELTNENRSIESYISAIRHCVVSFDF